MDYLLTLPKDYETALAAWAQELGVSPSDALLSDALSGLQRRVDQQRLNETALLVEVFTKADPSDSKDTIAKAFEAEKGKT